MGALDDELKVYRETNLSRSVSDVSYGPGRQCHPRLVDITGTVTIAQTVHV
jgi:hypothetical protein